MATLKLNPAKEYAEQIELFCVHHPALRWATKNIAPIGCRTIRYHGMARECDCPLEDLRVVGVHTAD